MVSTPVNPEWGQYRRDQLRDLRMELGTLKTCQNAAIAVGLTGPSIVLALLRDTFSSDLICILVYVPLIILFPFWLIFFDKARTIARIVGFVRLQELLMFSNRPNLGIIGWETAIGRYWNNAEVWRYPPNRFFDTAILNWRLEEEKQFETFRRKMELKINRFFKATYWTTVYLIFLLFSFAIIGIGMYLSDLSFWLRAFVVGAALFNLWYNYLRYDTDDSYNQFIYKAVVNSLIAVLLMLLAGVVYWYLHFSSTLPVLEHLVIGTFPMDASSDAVAVARSTVRTIGIFGITGMATIGSIFFATVTYWVYSGLLFGRYTYGSFMRVWEIVLGVVVCRKSGTQPVVAKWTWTRPPEIDEDELFSPGQEQEDETDTLNRMGWPAVLVFRALLRVLFDISLYKQQRRPQRPEQGLVRDARKICKKIGELND